MFFFSTPQNTIPFRVYTKMRRRISPPNRAHAVRKPSNTLAPSKLINTTSEVGRGEGVKGRIKPRSKRDLLPKYAQIRLRRPILLHYRTVYVN